MIPDALDFILRPANEEQAEYAAAHKTPAPAEEGKAEAGAGQTSATPALSPRGVADTDSSDADAVGAPASEVQTPAPGRVGNHGERSRKTVDRAQGPRWSAVDDETADLLSLVANEHPAIPSEAEEWHRFTQALEAASDLDGRIDPNFLRPLLRGSVAPNRIGAFTNRAKAEGLIAWDGEWVTSDDTEGRNSGKPCRVYRWLGAAS